jgi:hypothetical protein
MSDIGGQAGGFNTPYTPVRDTRVAQDQTAIRQVSPKAAPDTQVETPALAPEAEQAEIVNVVLQRRLDAQEIHKRVGEDRAKQADSFTRSGEDTGAARAGQLSQFAGQVLDQNQREQLNRQRLAQNLNSAQLGQKAAPGTSLDIADDQNLAANISQTAEDIDPDAKAKKELNTKLKKIQERGGSKGKDFVRFVESQKNDKGLLSDSITELVDGFLETLRGDSQTPSEMITAGEEPLHAIRDKVDPNNIEEMQAMRASLANSNATSAAERAELFAIRKLQSQGTERVAPPKPEMDVIKLSKHETAIRFISSINLGVASTPWDTSSAFATV